MKPFRFIHAADLHLDSSFKGISDIDSNISKELSEATFNTYNKIVDLCMEREVDFLLISGDIYNSQDRSLRAQLRFRDGLKRLSNKGIKVYIIHGNHDPLSGWSSNIEWPEDVHIFGSRSVEKEVFEKDEEPIANIFGISYPKREVTTNLTKKFKRISKSEREMFNIGMLHCNLGSDTGHEPYSPCTLDDLSELGYDYWALGHVHKKSVINEENPTVIYSGNPQGLNPKEIDERGCYLIDVDEYGDLKYEFLPTESVRWYIEEISIEGMSIEQDLFSVIDDKIEDIRRISSDVPSICRLILTGRGNLYSTLSRKGYLEDLVNEKRSGEEGERNFVWVESIQNRTEPEIDRDILLEREDFIGGLLNLFEEYYSDKEKIANVVEALNPLYSSPSGRKLLETSDYDTLISLLKKAEKVCLDRMIREGEM